ncbi:MAG TPA: hypothetical protein VKO86_04075 [Gemmatimonadales bacterium]|nr:hypothetical protein [Gemmatimonadales bacterium]
MSRSRPLTLVLTGGIIAGGLDIVYAIVFWAVKRGVPAQRILQSVAAGLLGRASFAGGLRTAALGLVLQCFIAVTMSLTYYLVSLRWARLWQRPLPYGAAYGALLYVIMNYLVVPLSAASAGSKDPLWVVLSIAVHMFLIGIPIALFTRRAHLWADARSPVPA